MAFNELRAIATFVKAAELGSLRRAAVAQAITPQAASQALSQLEAHLNVRLFHRTTRSLSLTEEGSRFLEAAQPGLAALHRALHGARRDREAIAGPLRITASRSVMVPVIWPVLDEFCRSHPGIEPEVHLDDRIGNWVDDRIDVGFRAGTPPGEGVVSRVLLPLQLVVCASPAYLKLHGAPRSIDDLSRHRCSGFRHPGTGKLMPWEFKVGQEVVAVDVASVVNVNDVDLEADAVVAGHCIGQMVGVTAAPLVRSGKLVPLLAANVTDHLKLHLYYGSRSAQPARVRAFIDLVVQRVVANTGAFVLSDKELSARRIRAGAMS
jgi:DNA-binding transcriptional LysR family regulator